MLNETKHVGQTLVVMLHWPSLLFHFLLYVSYVGQLFLIFINLLRIVCVVMGYCLSSKRVVDRLINSIVLQS